MRLYLKNILKNYLEEKLESKNLIKDSEFDPNFYKEKLSSDYEKNEIYLSILKFSLNDTTRYRRENIKISGEVNGSFLLTLKGFDEVSLDELDDKLISILNSKFVLKGLAHIIHSNEIEYTTLLNDFGPNMCVIKIKIELVAPIRAKERNQYIKFSKICVKGEFDNGE